MKASRKDTIAAIATPLGEGGLGVIRVSGPSAIPIVNAIFKKSRTSSPAAFGGGPMDPRQSHSEMTLLDCPSHTCHVGVITPSPERRSPSPLSRERATPSPYSREKGQGDEGVIDQAVVTLFRAPHSYTGEDVVEISAHGSPFTLQKILKLCLAKGAQAAGHGEFTERAFLNGKMDLTQAEAVAELIRAKTDKTQAAALAQMQGHLAAKVRSLLDKLLPLLAHIEVALDHSDEDHVLLSREELIEGCRGVEKEIDALLASARVGKILREGFRVAFLGRPNVGKSSLLNALLKEERAIVTPIPGTTRDTLEESLNLNGIPVVLTDTAGLRRRASGPVERLGMERTKKSLQEADLVIGLFDGSEELVPEDEDVIRQAGARSHIWVINKSDLPQRLGDQALHALNGQAAVVHLSAKTGEGLQTLADAIAQEALREKASATEAQWLLNARHQAALGRAKEALAHATASARREAYEECVALDLQTALAALGEVIGETTTEELLGQIFSQFCIGK